MLSGANIYDNRAQYLCYWKAKLEFSYFILHVSCFMKNPNSLCVFVPRFYALPYNHTTIQPHNPSTPQVHPTSKENSKAQKLKIFLSIIGENGASLKMLMEGMHLRDRKSFVNNYINPNLSEGFIAMLYPEIPNHPMQSYYLTNKGRKILEQL